MCNHPLFIQNKYLTWYNSIINNATVRDLDSGVYYEQHHILPKCICPELAKESSNLVSLTAKEHYICHHLLTKFTVAPLKQKMNFAFHWFITSNCPNHNRKFKISSTVYEHSKHLFSKSVSGKNNYNYKRDLSGENNPRFKGYYCTPFGTFSSTLEQNKVKPSTLIKWCKQNPDKIISKTAYNQSTYLQSIGTKLQIVGNSFRDLGFNFINS